MKSKTPLEIIKERKKNGYRVGADDDGHRVGLAFDPGCYSGIVGLAMGQELDEAGLIDYFDAFYGLSVGGINAAYVANHQAKDGLYVFTELMPGRFNRRFKVNLQILRDAIYKDRPLDLKELGKKPANIVVGATRLEGHKRIAVSSSQTPVEDLIEWALRGCHLPYLAGPPIKDEKGYHYSDATLSWKSTVELAKKDRATHLVSLSNTSYKHPSAITKLAAVAYKIPNWMAIKSVDLFIGYHNHFHKRFLAKYEKVLRYKLHALSHSNINLFTKDGIEVQRVYPVNPYGVRLPGLMTSDTRRLRAGIDAGKEAIREVIA